MSTEELKLPTERKPSVETEGFPPIRLKTFFQNNPDDISTTALILLEGESLKPCDCPLASGESEKVKALLKRSISEGLLTLEEYKQWRTKWGLYDFDDMSGFHILVLAGDLKNLYNGIGINTLPF